MVGHREKRCSNASPRGIESDRPAIRFTRVTQLAMKVGRGRLMVHPPQGGRSRRQPRRCSARSVWRILAGSEQRASKGVRVRGPEVRRWETTLRPHRDGSNTEANLLLHGHVASPHGSGMTTPSPPWPAGGFPTARSAACDEDAGAERSEALSPFGFGRREQEDESGGVRTRISYTGMLAHRVRDASASGAIPRSKDLEGDQSPGRIGRKVAGNGGRRYGPIRGATPRRCCITRLRHARRRRQRQRRVDRGRAGSEHQGGNDRGDTKRLQVGGILRRVRNALRGRGFRVTGCTSTHRKVSQCGVPEPPGRRRETQRTPGSAAGCNKPANPSLASGQAPASATVRVGGVNRRDRAKR